MVEILHRTPHWTFELMVPGEVLGEYRKFQGLVRSGTVGSGEVPGAV